MLPRSDLTDFWHRAQILLQFFSHQICLCGFHAYVVYMCTNYITTLLHSLHSQAMCACIQPGRIKRVFRREGLHPTVAARAVNWPPPSLPRVIRFSKILSDFCFLCLNHLILYLKRPRRTFSSKNYKLSGRKKCHFI